MPDADDFDIEELRRLLRGEGAQPRDAAPKPAPRAPVKPKASKDAGRPAAGNKKKPTARRKKP